MVEIVNNTGEVVMSVESLSREGGTLVIEGKLMGAWKSKMYFTATQLPKMIKLMLSLSLIIFLLMSPFTIIKEIWKGKRDR